MYRASTYGIFLPEAASYHEMLLKASGDKLGEATRAFLELGLTLPAHFYIQSQRARSIIMHGWNALFNTVDVVVGPTLPALAVPIGETDIDWGGRTEAVIDAYMRFCCVSNLTGLPSLTVPSGQDERGRTAGLQIIGPAFKETACLQVGALLESVTAQLAETNLERKNL
jgi:aspartyl-tRNA(Asn)/glutamyl-tRNA(Gln) amidotransferase subunit A